MQILEFADDEIVPIKELVELYEAVGWILYSADPDALARAIDRSTYVVTARDDGDLVGLARVMSDDVSIAYLQDVLVKPSHHRQGIGSVLVTRCLERFDHVRQKVLLTDDEPGQAAFYESLGYRNVNDLETVGLNAFVQFRGMTDL